MKINEIVLAESFKDATRKFGENADRETVQAYLDIFKDLTQRNIIRGQEKDISYWIKQGWEPFKEFVDTKRNEWSGKDIKKRRAVTNEDEIIIEDTDQRTIVIPLTKNAACKWGKHTNWCISALSDENAFFEYFVYENTVSIVFILKDGETITDRYIAVYDLERDKIVQLHGNEQEETNISSEMFFAEINKHGEEVSLQNIEHWVSENKNKILRAKENLIEKTKKKIEKRGDLLAATEIIKFIGYDHEWFRKILEDNNGYVTPSIADSITHLCKQGVISNSQRSELLNIK